LGRLRRLFSDEVMEVNDEVIDVSDDVIADKDDVRAPGFDAVDRPNGTPVSISLAVVSDSVSGCSPGVSVGTAPPPSPPHALTSLPVPQIVTSLPVSLFTAPKPTSRRQVEGGESTPPTDVATTLKQM